MNADDLTTEQAQQLRAHLAPTLGYLSRLQRRIGRQRFSPDDELYRLVTAAQDSMQALAVELHYRGMAEGCGRSSRR